MYAPYEVTFIRAVTILEPITMEFRFSKIVGYMKPSEIRELLKYASSPSLISLGGGMPNPETFPIEEMQEIISYVLKNSGKYALQYGNTGGLNELRSETKKLVKDTENIDADEKGIIITSGSQQALYALGKILVTPGEVAITEAPTYVGAISAFNANGVDMHGIPMDENGMRIDLLEREISDLKAKGIKPKFIYTIPNFQNPAGYTMSLERRKRLVEISNENGIPIIEDNPYGELRYRGQKIPSIKSLDKDGNVTYLGTFSKVMTPGLRIGYTVGPFEVIEKMNLLKQALDLSTNTLSQYIAYEYVKRGIIYEQIPKTIKLYKRKMEIMLKALGDYFPEGSTWSKPDGGMFIWATVSENIDTTAMVRKAIKNNVAYVSGSAFYPKGEKRNSMRLNFTYPQDEQIPLAIERLAGVIREEEALIEAK